MPALSCFSSFWLVVAGEAEPVTGRASGKE